MKPATEAASGASRCFSIYPLPPITTKKHLVFLVDSEDLVAAIIMSSIMDLLKALSSQ